MIRSGLFAALILLAPSVLGQVPDPSVIEDDAFGVIQRFELDATNPFVTLPVGGDATVELVFRDLSRDSIGGATGGAVPGATGVAHRSKVGIVPLEEKPGWQALPSKVSFNTYGNDEVPFQVKFQADPLAKDAYFQVEVNLTISNPAGYRSHVAMVLTGYTPGLDAFNAQVSTTYKMEPREIVEVPVKISNAIAVVPRSFDFELLSNDCGFDVATTNNNLVGAGATEEFPVGIVAPSEKFWYNSESCLITLSVFPTDNPGKTRTVVIVAQVAGFHVDPEWFFLPFWILLVFLILILLIKRRKERVEEEILGKPQKPWTIPAEMVYLDALKQKDERAWYVVRHYLMEDEYRSALMWYHAYKRATKGTRAKERLIVGQEHKFEKWQDSWAKKVSRPEAKADRYEARLQKRLDKRAGKAHRKALKKWSKQCKKLEEAHGKDVVKLETKWERDAKKARKKGLAEPPKPDHGEPDLPEEPEREVVVLAEHKWQAKADKQRLRMEKKEDRIRSRFSRKRERRLRKVRRKVHRMGRKLNDDAFVSEHPLLQ